MRGTRFIAVGRFIDGSGSDVRRNVLLAVKDGIITAIDSTTALSSQSDGVVVDDLTHCTVLPALVDCSVSLLQSPSVEGKVRSAGMTQSPAEKAAMRERHIRYCHAHGVLGVADSGDISYLTGQDQEVSAQGEMIEIRTSGGVCRSGQDWKPANLVRRDFIKIAYSGNIEDEPARVQRLSHADLCRILRRKGTRKAVVVANGRQQVQEALEAGCDAVEQGYDMGEENLRTMAANNVLWIPSMVRAKNAVDGSGSGGEVCCRFSLRYVAPGNSAQGDEPFWKKKLADHLTQLAAARRLGVTTAVGTGAGSVGILHGESMAEEVKLFLKAGYTLEETVRCASAVGAGFFNMEKLGELAVGRKAIFLVVRGTLKQLPRKLSYLEGIYEEGVPSSSYRKM